MWLKRSRNLLVCLWLMGAPCLMPALVSAQTPIDSGATSILAALRGPWGQLFIVGGVFVIVIMVLAAIQHPIILIYAGIAFAVLFMVGAAINGTMWSWFVGI